MKRIVPLMLALLMALPAAHAEDGRVYALVVKDTVNPYMQKMYEGFVSACDELGVAPRLAGAEGVDAGAQADVIEELIASGVSAMAVTANDETGVTEPLSRALSAGIQVVSLDSAVDPSCRRTHIQQADPQIVARALMQAAHRMISGSGQFAILSTTETMPNQATWVHLMIEEYEAHPGQYEKMQLVEIAYGNDEALASREQMERLLQAYPDLRIVIAPTTVGMHAAARVIRAQGSGVLITGLGLPSEMESYITGGECPWMYLWNPIDTGYLAAYALHALAEGQIAGEDGQVFLAGRFGEKIVTQSLDGGTEVVVGNPFKFDANNILSWKNVF